MWRRSLTADQLTRVPAGFDGSQIMTFIPQCTDECAGCSVVIISEFLPALLEFSSEPFGDNSVKLKTF